MLVIENSEPALHAVLEALATKQSNAKIEGRLADVRDRDRIFRLTAQFRPDMVFHAAALKHVPLLEQDWGEGVKTNVFGSVNVADAAAAAGALTCWGNGKLNARRASPESLSAISSLCFPPLNRAAALRLAAENGSSSTSARFSTESTPDGAASTAILSAGIPALVKAAATAWARSSAERKLFNCSPAPPPAPA